jgi:hypothetical protein
MVDGPTMTKRDGDWLGRAANGALQQSLLNSVDLETIKARGYSCMLWSWGAE